MKVSRPVSLAPSQENAKSPVTINQKSQSNYEETTPRLKSRRSSLYIIKNGMTFLFQIKVPRQLASASQRTIRIGLGHCSAAEARRLADIMGAIARVHFEKLMRVADMIESNEEEEETPIFKGAHPFEVLVDLNGYFKTQARFGIEQKPTAEELRKTEGLRDLVDTLREVKKKEAGQPHIAVIANNADTLKAAAIEKLRSQFTDPGATSTPEIVSSKPHLLKVEPRQDEIIPRVPAPRPMVDEEPFWQKADHEKVLPAFKMDRRYVDRPLSSKPLFSVITEDYLAKRSHNQGADNKDIRTAQKRLDLFLELIGDHRVDTYSGTDLDAFAGFLTFWPAQPKDRAPGKSTMEILLDNRDLHLKPLSRSAFEDGYMSIVRTAMRAGCSTFEYKNPFEGHKVNYPKTAAPRKPIQPLSSSHINAIFKTGVEAGMMDTVMLPLLGQLTGRRIGLLVHLKGTDFQQRYPDIYTAQTAGITYEDGIWKRIPIKTDASLTFFVLPELLVKIGFVEWAISQGDRFIFEAIAKLVDPSKSASSYMQRLFEKAGVPKKMSQSFHSLRGGKIDDMRAADVDARTRRLQAGHQIGPDQHELYGFSQLTQREAAQLASLPLSEDIDYSVFDGLEFRKIAAKRRTRGRQTKG